MSGRVDSDHVQINRLLFYEELSYLDLLVLH